MVTNGREEVVLKVRKVIKGSGLYLKPFKL